MMFENTDWTKNSFRVDPQMATFFRLGKDTTVLEMKQWDDMLTAYLVENNVIPEHSYLVDSTYSAECADIIVEKFLRDIAGGKYNTLIVPSFDQLPSLDEAKLPRFRVISLEEQVTREIGLLERPLIPSEDNAPNINNAAVYCRLAQQEQEYVCLIVFFVQIQFTMLSGHSVQLPPVR